MVEEECQAEVGDEEEEKMTSWELTILKREKRRRDVQSQSRTRGLRIRVSKKKKHSELLR